MQKESCAYDEKSSAASSVVAAASMHFSRCNPFVLPLSPTTSLINSNASPLFQNCSPNSTSGGILEYQQLYNRYTLCLAQLHDSMAEADALRLENDALRLSNADLTNRVAVLFSCDRFLCDFSRLNIASPSHINNDTLSEHNGVERKNTERVALPKSISVRSSGYIKINRPTTETSCQKPASRSIPEPQRVCVPILSKKEEAAVELEAYNQGMLKTELCDKWQETGACPYGDNCQFAHGINELRPVMRHPRYKTEVCRMALTGAICPYGHRCHFRHSLTDQERLVAATTPR